jgi:hypothetical protein
MPDRRDHSRKGNNEMKSHNKQSWAVLVFFVGATPGHAQSLPPAPTVQVIAVPDGGNVQASGNGFSSLDLGHVSWAHDNQQWGLTHRKDNFSFNLTTKIGVRADCGAAGAGRLASIRAFLNQPDPHYRVLLDGATLGSSPIFINALPCGSTSEHTFGVSVPVTAPAGPLNVMMVFEVRLQ